MTDRVKWVDKYGIIHEYDVGEKDPMGRPMELLSVVQAQLAALLEEDDDG